jgi:PAS domain S-box-containing protein
MAGEEVEPFEIRALTKSKEIRWRLDTNTRIYFQGAPAILVNSMDITERKQAEEALRRSEEKYRKLVNTLHEGITVVDSEARLTYVNRRFAEMLGYSVEEMTGKYLYSFTGEEGRNILLKYLERRLRGLEDQYDFSFIRKDGSVLETTMSSSPMTDDSGNYIGGVAAIIDISERKRIEKELALKAEMLDNAGDAISVTDTEGRIIYANETFCKGYELDREEIIGLEYWTLKAPLMKIDSGDIESKLRKYGETIFEAVRYPEGRNPIYIEIHSRVIDIDGTKYVLNIGRDITERRQKDAELELRAALLDNAGDMITVIDTRQRVLYANEKYCTILGCSLSELKGKKISELKSQIMGADHDEIGKKLMSEGEVSYEAVRRLEDGRLMDIEVQSRAMKINGRTIFLNIQRDITERKRKDAELQLKAEMLDNAGDSITVVDFNQTLLYANQSYCK